MADKTSGCVQVISNLTSTAGTSNKIQIDLQDVNLALDY